VKQEAASWCLDTNVHLGFEPDHAFPYRARLLDGESVCGEDRNIKVAGFAGDLAAGGQFETEASRGSPGETEVAPAFDDPLQSLEWKCSAAVS
jgi:hypothetical protein